ncbi:MAG: ABC transporter substrate-binding protein [Candidatus Rokuibacteriota bacterium]|nr:MAG: ABC transporter substrate-binding protein [Candidatus Rokubacteria bacterium]
MTDVRRRDAPGVPRHLFVLAAVSIVMLLAGRGADAQERPRYGGELVYVVPTEPASYDGHREGTFALVHPLAPVYSTLLRFDPTDRTGTKVVGDLAESWTVAKDGRTYTFKIRRGVRFHDGSDLTSKDVKASYDKIVNPPADVISFRKGQYTAIEAIEAPDPTTVIFRLKWPAASLITALASPFNWIYKADILAKDMHWYETHVMGSGAFVFVEHVKGAYWAGKKNPSYWDKGKPYLDGYRALVVKDGNAQVAAVRAERAHVQFRGFTPAERDSIVQALGPKVTVQESPWDCVLLVGMNHEKKPWDDKRARRALTLALDRYQGSQALSKIAIVKSVGGVQVPGTPFATPPAELEKLAGYSHDTAKSRAEARRLLKEAGVPEGFAFSLKNRNVPMPYEPVAIWLVDQWRRVGLQARHDFIESTKWEADLREGNYEVAVDTQCSYAVDPDLDLYKFQSMGISGNNYGRYVDQTLDDLYQKQSRALDAEERKKWVRDFERRLLDEEAHYAYTLQWHRIIPHSAKLRGWTITPSHFVNNQLDGVWLSE